MSAATIIEKPDTETYGREQIAAAGDDPAKLRALAERMLKRIVDMEESEAAAWKDASDWEDQANDSAREAEDALFKRRQIDRLMDLVHEPHDQFPWRMCREEACELAREATGQL